MKKVLVIDNDESILKMIEEALNYEGYQVKTYTDTENIFMLIKEFNPDLIIMDYILNGINGGKFCRQVKNNPATAALPVIICSAFSRVIASLGNYGCDVFMAKPFDLTELLDNVKQLTNMDSSSAKIQII